MRTAGLWLVMAALCACKPKAADRASPDNPTRTTTINGFRTPESVKWDSTQDVYFVSNINGAPNAKDGNGYISRISPDGAQIDTAFIKGLNAPKGMALVHDTLWVTDIDLVRSFNAESGAPIATIQVPGAVFLNDIAAAPDGSLYVTDTATRFGAAGAEHIGTDQIYKITRGAVSVALRSDSLGRPNGISWDQKNNRFIIASFGAGSILAWNPESRTPTSIGTGPGQFDGVEVVDNTIWVSSWADSAVYRYRNGEGTNLIKGVPSPADIGYDSKRHRILIPVFTGNRVEIWTVE
jgi:sugar lactone lactonase YvrE